LHHKQTLTNQIYLKEQVSNYLFTKYQQQQMKIVKVALIQRHANKSTKILQIHTLLFDWAN
jgi:hypothetical protein